MRSPRFIRPHRILVRNRIDEIDGEVQYQTTTINHVCVDASYGIKQSQKGIQPDGDMLVILDMNDLVAFEGMKKRKYLDLLEFEKLEDTSNYFTLRPDVDLIVYKGHEYTINSVSEINPVREEPAFLEVIGHE